MEQGFSFRFDSIVRGHHVYKGALNKKYFDNRIKPALNSEYALVSEMRLTTCEYNQLYPLHHQTIYTCTYVHGFPIPSSTHM